jgi:hypothetical protein
MESSKKDIELWLVPFNEGTFGRYKCENLTATLHTIDSWKADGATNYEVALKVGREIEKETEKKYIWTYLVTDGVPNRGKQKAEQLLQVIHETFYDDKIRLFNIVSISPDQEGRNLIQSLTKGQQIELKDQSQINPGMNHIFHNISLDTYATNGQFECEEESLNFSDKIWTAKAKVHFPAFECNAFINHIFFSTMDKLSIRVLYQLPGDKKQTKSPVLPTQDSVDERQVQNAIALFVLRKLNSMTEDKETLRKIAPKISTFFDKNPDYLRDCPHLGAIKKILIGDQVDQAELSNAIRGIEIKEGPVSPQALKKTSEFQTKELKRTPKRKFQCGMEQDGLTVTPSAPRNSYLMEAAEWIQTFDQKFSHDRQLVRVLTRKHCKSETLLQMQTTYSDQSMIIYKIGEKYIQAREWNKAFAAFWIYRQLLEEDKTHGPNRQEDRHLEYLSVGMHQSNKIGTFMSNVQENCDLVTIEMEDEMERLQMEKELGEKKSMEKQLLEKELAKYVPTVKTVKPVETVGVVETPTSHPVQEKDDENHIEQMDWLLKYQQKHNLNTAPMGSVLTTCKVVNTT